MSTVQVVLVCLLCRRAESNGPQLLTSRTTPRARPRIDAAPASAQRKRTSATAPGLYTRRLGGGESRSIRRGRAPTLDGLRVDTARCDRDGESVLAEL